MRLDVQDVVGLPSEVRWDERAQDLVDTTLGARHAVNDSAAEVVGALAEGGWTVEEVSVRLADRYGIPTDRAREDVLDLLRTLDDQALLAVRRPRRLVWSRSGVAGTAAAFVTGGDLFRAYRLPATVRGVARATTRILLWPTVVLLVGAGGLVLALRGVRPDLGTDVLVESSVLVAALVACLWATMAFHEIGHLLALGWRRDRAVVVVRGWRMALLRPRDLEPEGRARSAAVAVAGPIAGLAGGLAVAPLGLLPVLGLEFAVVACAVGLSHLVHLGPWAADGAMLARAVRRTEVRRAAT